MLEIKEAAMFWSKAGARHLAKLVGFPGARHLSKAGA
jgi:hypothetical protein